MPATGLGTSNNTDRPMRGERRRGDGSQDLFLCNLNFADDGDEEKQRVARRSASGSSLRYIIIACGAANPRRETIQKRILVSSRSRHSRISVEIIWMASGFRGRDRRHGLLDDVGERNAGEF